MQPPPPPYIHQNRLVSWKGRTVHEIVHRNLQNAQVNPTTNKYSLVLFRAAPLKHFRKETPFTLVNANNPQSTFHFGGGGGGGGSSGWTNFREKRSIDEINRPGGCTVSTTATTDPNKLGYEMCMGPNGSGGWIVLDPSPSVSNPRQTNCSDARNALRRVRSSGTIPHTYLNNRNNATYCTSTKQYLDSRQRSFAQNTFQYFRSGNSNVLPGSPLAKSNVYAAQGTNHCLSTANKYFLSTTTTFDYFFPNTTTTTVSFIQRTVSIPGGQYYDIDALNNLLFRAQVANGDAYSTRENNYAYLNFYYDNISRRIVVAAYAVYVSAAATYAYPYISVTNADFSQLMGFAVQGTYPPAGTPVTDTRQAGTLPLLAYSTLPFSLVPVSFRELTYKPNNYQYSQQGGVSASERILRLKYNTINSNAATYETPYGRQVANALAYSVSDGVFHSLKDKIGFPLPKYIKVEPTTGQVICCRRETIAG